MSAAIRKSVAILFCERIRRDYAGKWYTIGGLMCWSCQRSARGDVAKMRMRKKKGYRGCRLVNDWYAKLSGTKGKEQLRKKR